MGRYGLGAAHTFCDRSLHRAGGILFDSRCPHNHFNLLSFLIERILLIVVVDCYLPVASEFLLSVGLRNVFGFGFSYGVIPRDSKGWISACFLFYGGYSLCDCVAWNSVILLG